MRRYGLACVALALAAIPVAAHAQGEYLVQVKPGPNRYFHLDNEERAGCPALTVACRRTAYVMPGDQLIALGTVRKFTRVVHITAGTNRRTRGWIETAALKRVRTEVTPEAWIGRWRGATGAIEITLGAQPGGLKLHLGAIEAELGPVGDLLVYPDGDCRIQMRLMGPYLSVANQGNCGGANATLAGLYRR